MRNTLVPRCPVLVIGAAFGDVILDIQQLPHSGGDETARETGRQIGGCAFNVARALKRLGANVINGIPVGTGVWGNAVECAMQAEQLPVLLRDSQHDNGWCLALVEPHKERTFITIEGCEQFWNSQLLAQLDISAPCLVYVSGYELVGDHSVPLQQWLLSLPAHCQLFVDFGPRLADISADFMQALLARKPWITLNRDEAALLLGNTATPERLHQFATLHQLEMIVRLDAQGAQVYQPGKEVLTVPPLAVTLCDSVGAGDAHCGGTLMGLSCGWSLAQAVALGNQVAAIVVSRPGADGAPYAAELHID